MPDEIQYPPEVIRPQILQHAKHVLAISLWNDENANILADSLGAEALLDKTKMYAELVPAIRRCCGEGKPEFQSSIQRRHPAAGASKSLG